jgi:glycosyltransferase involved in cell wall biosynthesis
MDVLFVHQNFPAQFVHIARDLQRNPDVRAVAVTDLANENADFLPAARYRFDGKKAGAPDRLSQNFAARVARGRMAARAMAALRRQGVRPAVIVGHLGWGETLFARDVFPDARLIVHAEFYYSRKGADVGFDAEFREPATLDRAIELRAKNAAILAAMAEADVAIAPTRWQASRFPDVFQSKLTVLHEGVDTDLLRPNPNARFSVAGAGLTLGPEDEVITFVNRNLEPYRGYHIFMRALPAILAARPKARAVIVGGDGVSYGPAPPGGGSWRTRFLEEVADRLPMDRVHFVSQIPFADFVSLMQISSAHVYWTYPFVLSWSILQAMSAGAPVIASRTAPVQEVIEDGVNGLLVDFFDVEGLARRVIETLEGSAALGPLRKAARQTIQKHFDLERLCLPKWRALIGVG